MERLLLIDRNDYDGITAEISRVAVRGIILIEDKLLLIESSSGEVKLPGGGQEDGEDDITTLCREVSEEVGCDVIPDSVREFGSVEERRRAFYEEAVWHQINRLYFCDVNAQQHECCYSENEMAKGFRRVTMSVDEAVEKSRLASRHKERPYNQREYNTFLLIKEYLKGDSL